MPITPPPQKKTPGVVYTVFVSPTKVAAAQSKRVGRLCIATSVEDVVYIARLPTGGGGDRRRDSRGSLAGQGPGFPPRDRRGEGGRSLGGGRLVQFGGAAGDARLSRLAVVLLGQAMASLAAGGHGPRFEVGTLGGACRHARVPDAVGGVVPSLDGLVLGLGRGARFLCQLDALVEARRARFREVDLQEAGPKTRGPGELGVRPPGEPSRLQEGLSEGVGGRLRRRRRSGGMSLRHHEARRAHGHSAYEEDQQGPATKRHTHQVGSFD